MEIKDVENLAEIAKIELTEEEKKEILSDMGSILAYVKQIEEAEVGDLELAHTLRNSWREDEVESRDFSMDIIKDQFPESQDGFLKVKKIL